MHGSGGVALQERTPTQPLGGVLLTCWEGSNLSTSTFERACIIRDSDRSVVARGPVKRNSALTILNDGRHSKGRGRDDVGGTEC